MPHMMRICGGLLISSLFVLAASSSAFFLKSVVTQRRPTLTSKTTTSLKLTTNHELPVRAKEYISRNDRRAFLLSLIASTVAVNMPKNAFADTEMIPVEMKTFVDPKGLFIINVPKRFFTIRRTFKGDLPNEETGKGRRGSSIATFGDLAKAEMIAVERFPVVAMLQEEGISPNGDLSDFASIGDPKAIANLISIRRDKDKNGQIPSTIVPNSVSISEDKKTLFFKLLNQVEVQRPELLMEEMGIDELVRTTLAKATLTSNDGQMMVVFASALKQDLAGSDGLALQESIDTFVALDPTVK